MAINLKDLPESIVINLDEEMAVKYAGNDGDMAEAYELELICFGRNQFNQTWPLRQRLTLAMAKMAANLSGFNKGSEEVEETEENQTALTVSDIRNACIMGEFDLMAGLEEFKQFACSGKLIKIDDDLYMNKARWEKVDDIAKEEIFFTYLANFIGPCVQ